WSVLRRRRIRPRAVFTAVGSGLPTLVVREKVAPVARVVAHSLGGVAGDGSAVRRGGRPAKRVCRGRSLARSGTAAEDVARGVDTAGRVRSPRGALLTRRSLPCGTPRPGGGGGATERVVGERARRGAAGTAGVRRAVRRCGNGGETTGVPRFRGGRIRQRGSGRWAGGRCGTGGRRRSAVGFGRGGVPASPDDSVLGVLDGRGRSVRRRREAASVPQGRAASVPWAEDSGRPRCTTAGRRIPHRSGLPGAAGAVVSAVSRSVVRGLVRVRGALRGSPVRVVVTVGALSVETFPHARVRRLSGALRSEEHTSELQSRENLVCRLLLEKKTPLVPTARTV